MKDFRLELRWGILFSLTIMIWMFIEKNLGWHDEHIRHQLGNHFLVLLLIFIVIYYLGLREKRNNYYKGTMSWKQGLISGSMISVIIAILSPLTQYFIYHYISPDYFQNMINYQTGKSEYPMSVKSADLFFTMKSYLIQAVFTDLSFGIIISAMMALVLRKKPTKK